MAYQYGLPIRYQVDTTTTTTPYHAPIPFQPSSGIALTSHPITLASPNCIVCKHHPATLPCTYYESTPWPIQTSLPNCRLLYCSRPCQAADSRFHGASTCHFTTTFHPPRNDATLGLLLLGNEASIVPVPVNERKGKANIPASETLTKLMGDNVGKYIIHRTPRGKLEKPLEIHYVKGFLRSEDVGKNALVNALQRYDGRKAHEWSGPLLVLKRKSRHRDEGYGEVELKDIWDVVIWMQETWPEMGSKERCGNEKTASTTSGKMEWYLPTGPVLRNPFGFPTLMAWPAREIERGQSWKDLFGGQEWPKSLEYSMTVYPGKKREWWGGRGSEEVWCQERRVWR
ncbi:hypothetical protein BJ508DRAFT_311772 [Ascobolus immersus RN42]|uniref:Uncharacterized protein n=1 Tax=Ascobolus immersus RN42 TaxID=1160509 RepID=A0A3N4HPD2_ASCIM|nr:hypothetical protein BJ508DRAFT_311772 [Ascobolus immersus RN42]